MTTRFKVCSCNHSMPLTPAAGEALGMALDAGTLPVASQLCHRQTEAYLEALEDGEPVVVGCTQERALFTELATQQQSVAPLRFVNLRETGGWGAQAASAIPKMAALLADAALPAAEPVPTVSYASQGRVLIIGSAERALPWAERLQEQLSVSVLLTGGSGDALPHARRYPVVSGEAMTIRGWLGAFTVDWQQANPIDLDLCVHCNACLDACPEKAINALLQVDRDRCAQHQACVQACGAVGAIDFSREARDRTGQYDLIFDLSATPLITLHQPPQGYFAASSATELDVALRLVQMTGEFEKPRYFRYKETLCAHGRNRKTGCNACVDICSAGAVSSDGNRIKVDPHLCMGCGACTTVCPTGALAYAYPNAPHTGRRLKTMLKTYAKAGGRQARLLLHSDVQGAALVNQLGRLAKTEKRYQGLPARLIPLPLHHSASVGIDLWLTAIAYGAVGVMVLVTGEEAPQYVYALRHQMTVAQTILSGLGYGGTHLQLIEAMTPDALDDALQQMPNGMAPETPATFLPLADKRNTLDFALAHLHQHAPLKPQDVALPEGAPFGALKVDSDACTLCMSCTGACPSSALMATPDRPQLRFVEKNCVQCGLCVQTCPENAITLVPRLSFTDAATKPQVLCETEPFTCIRCNKPFGTLKVVESMLGRLSGHAAFAGNLDRIRMCGDCRVVDMMETRREATITELKRAP